MKNPVLVMFVFFIALSGFAKAQGPHGDDERGHKKLEQLEKIKLIESLDMNEETTLKFFARRNAHRDKMQELMDQLDNKSKEIQKLIKNKAGDSQLKQAVNEYLELENSMPREKTEFINSLNDILSQEQIAKLVIFEKMFREEVRKIIFRERGKRRE